jgi:hypothetical protein
MPITLSGVVAGSNSLTLTDSDTGSSSSVVQGATFSSATRPANGPPASPAATDLVQIYASRVFRKSYTGVDSTTGQTITLANIPDVFCNTGNCTKVSSIYINNTSNQPLTFGYDDLYAASGDLLKIPAYGKFSIMMPMDGVTRSAANMTIKCGQSGQTVDATVVITYQV